jgi:hypothetical protein
VAAYSELTLEQYATFSTTVNVQDIQGDALNLTNYSTAAQLRKSYYSSNAVSFNVFVSNISTGEITMVMDSANTANISPGRYVYDLTITSPTNVKTRVVEGIVNVLPGVTR